MGKDKRNYIIVGLLGAIVLGFAALAGIVAYGVSKIEEVCPGYYQVTIIGPEDTVKVIEGDIPYIISKLEEAKAIHEYYLTVPPDPETGSHVWHKRWVEIYEEAIKILEQVR